jgi:S1-C subfamily serine protease
MTAGDERTGWLATRTIPTQTRGYGTPIARDHPIAYGPPPQSYGPPGYPAPYDGPSRPPYQPAAPPAPKRRRNWAAGLTLALVLLLAAGLVYQTVRIERLSDRLAANEKVLVETQARDNTRLDGLAGRAAELEKKLGSAFDPEAISTAALPSVFRVNAGDFSGTAFAVGKPASGGGTNLFTNWHVVEALYTGGGRKVTLERKSDKFDATIVKVDKTNDVAQLKTDAKVAGLATATGEVKSGQQIVVVGAPLGLTDSVTSGVVSAVRKLDDSAGPLIQFDASINPGNSGGPVINASKQVVGIATAKARNAEGIGLAVPIATACATFKIC